MNLYEPDYPLHKKIFKGDQAQIWVLLEAEVGASDVSARQIYSLPLRRTWDCALLASETSVEIKLQVATSNYAAISFSA